MSGPVPAPKPPPREWVPLFREFVSGYPCIVCVKEGGLWRYSDPHHVKHRGAGGDDPENVVPLCRVHHRECESTGQLTFESKYHVDLHRHRVRLWQTWLGLPQAVREPAF